MIEIEPAEHSQVVQAGDDWIIIEEDICSIAKRLKELDSRLHIRFNPVQNFYAIFAREKGAEYLVGTYKSLDERILRRIEYIMSDDYNFAKESEKEDEEKDKEKEYAIEQKIGENAERLAYALRKDLEIKDRIFIPGTNYG